MRNETKLKLKKEKQWRLDQRKLEVAHSMYGMKKANNCSKEP
ncbi:hypothetical protein HHE01_00050 [Helicobacter heilmannii]|uniref:Uncharacterized protein n=1 Tax=Helicobacter heilmannii TaxID=35817 RepID=A0A0K2Y838_HELHE|nr:hypothetical protein HHE01_00050 [Helicobacter heilmannii]